MKKTLQRRSQIQRLALMALLTAMVAVLAYFGGFIKIGGLASISLTLIPVVIGAAICGPLAGAWLGGVSGAIFFATADAAFWFGLSVPGTIITVMVKGILAGLCAGLAYKLLEKYNRYLAIIAAAIVCPIVNTGVFLLGCLIFFMSAITEWGVAEGFNNTAKYMFLFLAGANFLAEISINILLAPIILRIVEAVKKR